MKAKKCEKQIVHVSNIGRKKIQKNFMLINVLKCFYFPVPSFLKQKLDVISPYSHNLLPAWFLSIPGIELTFFDDLIMKVSFTSF